MFLTNRSFLLKYHLGWVALTGRSAPSAYWGSSKGSSTSVSCLHSPDLKEIKFIFTLSHRDIYEKPKFIPHHFLNCALFQIKLEIQEMLFCCYLYFGMKHWLINSNTLHRWLQTHGYADSCLKGGLQSELQNLSFPLPSLSKHCSHEDLGHFCWGRWSTAQTASKRRF